MSDKRGFENEKNKGGGKTKLRKEDKMGEELLIGNFEREEK